MLGSAIAELGPWSWWVGGLVLLAAELVVPGVFLVWIGIGAIITGMLSLMLWDTALWSWHVQLLVFAAAAVVSTLIGRRLLSGSGETTDQPLLNQRIASLTGRVATLPEPIIDGRGRIRIDDTYWSVTGADMPAGTKVRVVAGAGPHLAVEPADTP